MLKNLKKIPVSKKTEDIWVYQLEPANAIVGAVLMALFTFFFFLHAMQNNMVLSQEQYLFFAIIVTFAFLFITKKKVLEINRRDKTISKKSQVLFFRKSKIWSVTAFDSIKITPKTVPLEEGYIGIVYSLVLVGPRTSIEILSVDGKEEAEKHLYELSVFLNVKVEDAMANLRWEQDHLAAGAG